MKTIRYLLAVSMLSFGMGCTEKFDEINTNPKSVTVNGLDQSSYGLVVKKAFYGAVFYGDVMPFLRGHAAFTDLYANYQAHTHPDFFSDSFVLNGAWLNEFFTGFYRNAAPQIKYVEDFAVANNYQVEAAMMKVWRVYTYHKITDFWGPIPYSNFGNGEKTVRYDSQDVIYHDFLSTLEGAIEVFKANAGQTSFLGSQDVIYGGKVDQWLKLASTLRLRLAMRIKYVEPELAKTHAEQAVADGVITDNADNGYVTSSIDWPNPYNTITQWSDFRMSADMESVLKGYLDPRVADYYSEAAQPDAADDPAGVVFNYEGIRNGQSKSDKQGQGFNAKASNMAAPYLLVGSKGPNWQLLRAAEAYFLRAEGALEGWNMGGTPEALYNQGVLMSLAEYGHAGTDLLGNDYLTSTRVPVKPDAVTAPASTVPIAYDASAGKERQLEQIITQKWIALYPDSEEAWAERRRTGYPVLLDRLMSDNPDFTVSDIPRRLPYVSSEFDTNREAVEEAITLLGGADNGVTKLWWDKK
ncbi:SusD/RagB family nutrient-binding outer membrane lipoprotein [Parapedobacter lycopersici]|uniref:SusD/RagB family nutrient-binding outer membrane lipoprotein n=1 Tax=Parapedobacter lycopersici TaxID=1864939 RepID=UPI0033400B87